MQKQLSAEKRYERKMHMAFCPKCHSETKPGAKFCGVCGEILTAPAASYAAAPAYTPAPAAPAAPVAAAAKAVSSWASSYAEENRRRNQMPQGIDLGVGEVVVKQYRVGRYTFRKGYIDVVITNKRVIRYEDSTFLGLQTNRIDELYLTAINGITCWWSRTISVIGLMFALAFILGGLGLIISGANAYYGPEAGPIIGGLVGIALGVLVLIKSFKPTVIFYVQGAHTSPAVVTAVNVFGRIIRDGQGAIFQFKPTAETAVMLKEVGACVYDLKTMGDEAISKWRS